MGVRFVWGKVLERFDFNFDGKACEVIKYHPWKTDGVDVLGGTPDESQVLFHCEEIRESFGALDALLISWIANRRLGKNQSALVRGIVRALDIKDDYPVQSMPDGAVEHRDVVHP